VLLVELVSEVLRELQVLLVQVVRMGLLVPQAKQEPMVQLVQRDTQVILVQRVCGALMVLLVPQVKPVLEVLMVKLDPSELTVGEVKPVL